VKRRPVEDFDLIQRFLDGEPEAVGTVDRWIASASAPYRMRLADCWDDLQQEIRLELVRHLGRGDFRGDASFKTYLWRVANHTCVDQLRHRRRWRWDDFEDIEQKLVDEGVVKVSAERRHLDRDLAAKVQREASPECARLWSWIAQGLSYAEMGERLGVAPGTLRVRVLRCRKKAAEIRKRLREGGESREVEKE
jgi:RNA polymerase sigma-70 factor (ECF subfamily)